MSINSALLSGVSGLLANSTALSSISDNIANSNTVGYKQGETDFEDVVTASAVRGSYNAGGVLGVTRRLVSQQGDFTQTTSSTDLAIAGQGLFVVTSKPDGLTSTDERDFTRAGSFTRDAQGYLRNTSGFYLQGWLADANGNIATDPSDLTKLSSINISSFGGAAEATTSASVNANLNSAQLVSAAGAAYKAGDISAGKATPDFTVPISVADSQGGTRNLDLQLIKTGTNTWAAEVVADPKTDVTDPNGLIAQGVVAFTTDGKLDPKNTTLPASLTLGASGGAAAAGGPNWAANLGISAQTIGLDLSQAPGGLTQASAKSVVQSVTTNGATFGNLTAVDIGADGYVTANYDNGVSRKIAQVAVATFPNPDGLRAASGDVFQVSLDSGTYNLKTAGTGGAGKLSPSTLEASTVDLSKQFSDLIVTQRAYSASSKIITTADEMLQDLIDIKR